MKETIASYVYRLEAGKDVDENIELEDSCDSLEEELVTVKR